MNKYPKLFYLMLSILLITSCSKNEHVLMDRFKQRIDQFQTVWAPDLSLTVFNFELKKEAGHWSLRGETTLTEAETVVIAFTDSLLGKNNYEQKIIHLPDPVLADSTYGIVTVSTAQLRRYPKHSAELVDQSIMGNVIRLLKKEGMWYLVQTHYGYLGWMMECSFRSKTVRQAEEWESGPGVIVSGLFGLIYSKADASSTPVADVVLNARCRLLEDGLRWKKIQIADGREGYISASLVQKYNPQVKAAVGSADIVQTAKSMIGIPYLWGGNSSKANDCSGFTQTVFKKHDIQLPRDARQQVLIGDEIIPTENFSNVRAGDLLFFGVSERITHVGISLGGFDFIHQDSYVNISSFDAKAANYNDFRKKTLKKIKRII